MAKRKRVKEAEIRITFPYKVLEYIKNNPKTIYLSAFFIIAVSVSGSFEIDDNKVRFRCGYNPKRIHVGKDGVTVQSHAEVVAKPLEEQKTK